MAQAQQQRKRLAAQRSIGPIAPDKLLIDRGYRRAV